MVSPFIAQKYVTGIEEEKPQFRQCLKIGIFNVRTPSSGKNKKAANIIMETGNKKGKR
jgi:hypothetical protein